MYKPEIYRKHNEIKNKKELLNKVKKDKIYYPSIHLAPEMGLLNDPNGLAFYNNEYHIFYQYHPNQPLHGLKNWYHLTTKDFINYTKHGIILFPEKEYENYGIFSGNAVLKGEYLQLNYTANYRDENKGFKREPKQCYALMNKDYEIIEKGILVEFSDEKYTEHYRDPYITDDGDILVGAQLKNKEGALSVITDGIERTLYMKNELSQAYMIECPNYCKIDDYEILILSPQGILNEKYLNPNSVVWLETDLKDDISSVPQLLDHGFDFYAPQTFRKDNQVYLLGWLGHADTIYPGDKENGWSQMLTLMRKVNLKEGILYQQPHPNYKQLRTEWMQLETRNSLRNKVFELELVSSSDFELEIGDGNYCIRLSRNGKDICLDRSQMENMVSIEFGSKRYICLEEEQIEIQVFVDKSAIEIYINQGRYVMSARFFIHKLTELTAKGFTKKKINYLNSINIK